MATLKDMRKMSRDGFYIPVTHTSDHATSHHKPMMHTFSEDGLYFESRDPVGPGTDLIEKMANRLPVSACGVTTVPIN